jgi:hypothetical protein
VEGVGLGVLQEPVGGGGSMTVSDWIRVCQVVVTIGLTAVQILVTVVLAFVAIFGNEIRAMRVRPKLAVSIEPKPPDCIKVPTARYEGDQQVAVADSYYLRLKVTNTGNDKAESVEVFIDEVRKRAEDGTFRTLESFLPMNLVWADYHQVFIPIISPGMHRHCDLGHVIDPEKRGLFPAEAKSWPGVPPPKAILSLATAAKSHTLGHLLPLGTYHLTVVVAAMNAKPATTMFELELTGDWYDDEREMLCEGIRVRVL